MALAPVLHVMSGEPAQSPVLVLKDDVQRDAATAIMHCTQGRQFDMHASAYLICLSFCKQAGHWNMSSYMGKCSMQCSKAAF